MKAKKALGGMLACALVAVMTMSSNQSMCRIPKLMRADPEQGQSYSFFLPEPERTAEDGQQVVEAVAVLADQERILIPGGQSIGLTMNTEGVFIVEAADVYLADGTAVNPARRAGLTSGDCILCIDGQSVSSMQELTNLVTGSEKGEMTVEYLRDGRKLKTTIEPVVDEAGVKRLGVWVRDSTAGIGTLTYIDPEAKTFGALGHAVTDVDTGRILPIGKGDVYTSEIMDVKKGTRGEAGELHGVFMGSWNAVKGLDKNTEYGVFGSMSQTEANPLYPEGVPAAEQSEVHIGAATLLTTVDGRGVQEFDCEIIRLTPQLSKAQRSMVIEITDPELLSITGGIVQGMSGSPILQDGKLVGAVTHVLVNDPTRGYGIYIENMLETAE